MAGLYLFWKESQHAPTGLRCSVVLLYVSPEACAARMTTPCLAEYASLNLNGKHGLWAGEVKAPEPYRVESVLALPPW